VAKDKAYPASPLAEAWKLVLHQPLIPFERGQRASQLADAYRELAEEVARWRQAGSYGLAHADRHVPIRHG
jgi:hypothetical protein